MNLVIKNLVDRVFRLKEHPFLLVCLVLTFVFSVNGIGWGRFECWNRDEMGLRSVSVFGKPGDYLHPPGYTYLNRVCVLTPIQSVQDIVRRVVGKEAAKQYPFNRVKVFFSRLFLVFLYSVAVIVAYYYCLTYYGVFAARTVALLFATSAGFIEYNHFLSTDSPLIFGMMLALFLIVRVNLTGRLRDYLMAGFAVGAAFNIKYNGLAVGIAFVVAHFLSTHNTTLRARFFSPKILKGLAMVPVGMLASNPYMLLDFHRFVADFMYVNVVTPRYEGQADGWGYLLFCREFPEILGMPGAILATVLAVASLVIVLWRRSWFSAQSVGFLTALSVFLLYFAKMGSFPRVETRYVLPCIPFFLLLTGPALTAIGEAFSVPFAVLLTPLIAYNCVCSFIVGERFKADPRMPALDWMQANLHPGLRVESSGGAPHWFKNEALHIVEKYLMDPHPRTIGANDIVDTRLPHCNGRAQLFTKVFANSKWVDGSKAALHEGTSDEALFTPEALAKRNPDIVTLDQCDWLVPSTTVRSYYESLMSEKFPYKVVYDRQSPDDPSWIYPKQIDFLRTRCVILVRK